eukprot:37897-Chlamydomonas_euryale.AAC.21
MLQFLDEGVIVAWMVWSSRPSPVCVVVHCLALQCARDGFGSMKVVGFGCEMAALFLGFAPDHHP